MGRRRAINATYQEKLRYMKEKMYPHFNPTSYKGEISMKKEEDYNHNFLIYKIKDWCNTNFFFIHENIHVKRNLIESKIEEIIEEQRNYSSIHFPLYKREITINLNNIYIINVIYSLKEISLISIAEYEEENISHWS
jgi:hypothetical protein